MSDEPNGTYWQGRMEARLDGIAEQLRLAEAGQLRRHGENQERLTELRQDLASQAEQIRELEKWQSYVRGIAMAWALGWSFVFTAVAELVRFLSGRH
jgi:hypothetical protein